MSLIRSGHSSSADATGPVPAPWMAEEQRLAVLRRSQLLDWPPEPEFDRWTAALRRETDAAAAALVLVDAERVFVKSLATAQGCAEEASEVPLSAPLGDYLIGFAEPDGSDGGPTAYAETEVYVEGRLLGWMTIANPPGCEWREGYRQALENSAAAVSAEVALRLANQEAARVRDLVASHNRLHELIAAAAPLSEVLRELVDGIERYEPSVIPCVVLLDRESNTLHPGAGPSLPPHYLASIDGVVIGPNVGTCGSAAWSGNLTISPDLAEDPKWAPIREFVLLAGLRHCWSMPIKAPDGEVLGTLALYGPQPRHPLPEHLVLMQDGARLAGIAIERHRTMERLIHDARHDGLTGLPNRAAIFEHLDRAIAGIEPPAKVAVLFVDLDGLKVLNDTLGHDRADEMISQIGARLSASVRAGELVGRFGGDEFVLIAEGITEDDQAAELGSRLLDAISKPLVGLESTVVTASIGIALIGAPDTGVREAIRQADSAMYMAKRAGRGGCSFFSGSQCTWSGRSHLLGRELRNAEMRGEMRVVFQPVFELAGSELAGSELVGVEALLRWSSPTFGEVAPDEFIPIAESTGAIVPLGAWVLRESCEALARITEQTGRSLDLSVNVSAHQLARPGFAKTVEQTFGHAEFPVDRLILEITETALMEPDAVTIGTLREFESLGIRTELDDFGTGYSSLSSLKQHPINGIKIDPSFVRDLRADSEGRAIVGALIGLAGALNCTVTGEGVETNAQLGALRELGCERVQGFLLAKPMPEDELITLLLGSDGGRSGPG
jgi:diguanylate cyclase (GGDEF)-like protein